jgi:hypothetical protein
MYHQNLEGRVTTDCLFMMCACLLCQALRGVVGGGTGGHVLEWSADFSTLPHAAQRYTRTHTRLALLRGSLGRHQSLT